MNCDITLYVVHRPDGHVVYVGQTRYPKIRFAEHLRAERFSGCHCRTLRGCTTDRALVLEAQIIRAYRRRGEAEENKQCRPRGQRSKRVTVCIRNEVYSIAQSNAEQQHRSVSNYIESLIISD